MQPVLKTKAWWWERREPLPELVERCWRFFAALREVDPRFATWFAKGRSRKDALRHRLDVSDRALIEQLLRKGRNRADFTREVIEDLGYYINAWNGADRDEDVCSVSIHVGAWVPTSMNSVDLTFPDSMDPLAERETFVRAMHVAIECFDAEGAEVYYFGARSERPSVARRPFVDWIFWVPFPVAAVPVPAELRPGPKGGTTIISLPEPPDPKDESVRPHLAAVDAALGIPSVEEYERRHQALLEAYWAEKRAREAPTA